MYRFLTPAGFPAFIKKINSVGDASIQTITPTGRKASKMRLKDITKCEPLTDIEYHATIGRQHAHAS